MKLYKLRDKVIVEHNALFYSIRAHWDSLLNNDNLYDYLTHKIEGARPEENTILNPAELLAPIGTQEIWAAGVTYQRSKEARMEEAKESGGADFYAKVYDAERPELFFKSTASRCAGPHQPLNIRTDSKWNVPEPELTLFATASGKIVGYTIGNDMSSRDIEGENPLYLPQAKCYDYAAGLGPCIYVPKKPINPNSRIDMAITRNKEVVFNGNIFINQMKRSHTELIGYLFRETSFPNGVFLMTGTCLVPANDFTLEVGDVVAISIENIGTLSNPITTKYYAK